MTIETLAAGNTETLGNLLKSLAENDRIKLLGNMLFFGHINDQITEHRYYRPDFFSEKAEEWERVYNGLLNRQEKVMKDIDGIINIV